MVALKANPLPSEGIPGKLTAEQDAKLREIWKIFYDVCPALRLLTQINLLIWPMVQLIDEAPVEGNSAIDEGPKGADKPLEQSKDAAERDRQRQEQERANAKLALEKFGSKRFIEATWASVGSDNPDTIVLRFLRARKWDPSAGAAMMASCIKWRIETDVDGMIRKGEEGMQKQEGFIGQVDRGTSYTFSLDRAGRPVSYINTSLHRPSAQPLKAMEDFTVYNMECGRCLMTPPADKVSIIFNMNGFGLKNMDWSSLSYLIKCLEAYYPESMNVVMIHDAPWVVQGIWKVVAPMLDPVVRAKVAFTKNASDLFVHIPEKNVVKNLGGQTEWQWDFEGVQPGENDRLKDTAAVEKALKDRKHLANLYEQVNRRYANNTDDDESRFARRLYTDALRMQAFVLDSYTRGMTTYHRNNVCGNGTVLHQSPQENDMDVWSLAGDADSYEALRGRVTTAISIMEGAGSTVDPLLKELVAV